jgi:hypothetical protein
MTRAQHLPPKKASRTASVAAREALSTHSTTTSTSSEAVDVSARKRCARVAQPPASIDLQQLGLPRRIHRRRRPLVRT